MQALPYIKRYHNKTIVVKYGGSAMTRDAMKESVMGDIVLLSLVGIRVVLVHGGGPEITDFMKKIGKQPEFVDGLRVTDAETVDIVEMVLAGKINKTLVNLIENIGGKAIGLSGADGHLIEAKQYDPRLGFVGEITEINAELLTDMLDKGYIPVIASVGYDKSGNVYNVNADTAAASIATALNAECLFSLTDTVGILRDENDPDSLISEISVGEAPKLIDDGIITGGMIPKTQCCIDAIHSGVDRAFIIDGRVPHSIIIEIFTVEGMGTMFTGH